MVFLQIVCKVLKLLIKNMYEMTENSLLIFFCSENAKLAYLCQFAQVQMCLIICCAYEKPRHNSKLPAQMLGSLLFTHCFRMAQDILVFTKRKGHIHDMQRKIRLRFQIFIVSLPLRGKKQSDFILGLSTLKPNSLPSPLIQF